MAKRDQLRILRTGTVINATSKQQESEVIKALVKVVEYLGNRFGEISIEHKKQWFLKDIVSELRHHYPEVEFFYNSDKNNLRPDGGILFLKTKFDDHLSYPILIAEAKHQGTNDLRIEEGMAEQSKGNAIERLGKNLIGFRTALMRESIFPFVCFGYGCDFSPNSYILDRVVTMAMFGKLNTTYLHNEEGGKFNRGSFYFQCNKWTVDEMFEIMKDIAERSIMYYFSKYKEENFESVRL